MQGKSTLLTYRNRGKLPPCPCNWGTDARPSYRFRGRSGISPWFCCKCSTLTFAISHLVIIRGVIDVVTPTGTPRRQGNDFDLRRRAGFVKPIRGIWIAVYLGPCILIADAWGTRLRHQNQCTPTFRTWGRLPPSLCSWGTGSRARRCLRFSSPYRCRSGISLWSRCKCSKLTFAISYLVIVHGVLDFVTPTGTPRRRGNGLNGHQGSLTLAACHTIPAA